MLRMWLRTDGDCCLLVTIVCYQIRSCRLADCLIVPRSSADLGRATRRPVDNGRHDDPRRWPTRTTKARFPCLLPLPTVLALDPIPPGGILFWIGIGRIELVVPKRRSDCSADGSIHSIHMRIDFSRCRSDVGRSIRTRQRHLRRIARQSGPPVLAHRRAKEPR